MFASDLSGSRRPRAVQWTSRISYAIIRLFAAVFSSRRRSMRARQRPATVFLYVDQLQRSVTPWSPVVLLLLESLSSCTARLCPFVLHYYAPDRREEAVSFSFVRPSVCPSVAYIANSSRTQRTSVPKFGIAVTHLRCAYQFQGQTVKGQGHQAH